MNADVAVIDSQSQGGRPTRYSDLCLLEPSRASAWRGQSVLLHLLIISSTSILVNCPSLNSEEMGGVFFYFKKLFNLSLKLILQYDFGGRYDLVKFIKEIQAQGLYACLTIGPFIESEWTYG